MRASAKQRQLPCLHHVIPDKWSQRHQPFGCFYATTTLHSLFYAYIQLSASRFSNVVEWVVLVDKGVSQVLQDLLPTEFQKTILRDEVIIVGCKH